LRVSDSRSQIAHPAITTEITTEMAPDDETDESITRVCMAQFSLVEKE